MSSYTLNDGETLDLHNGQGEDLIINATYMHNNEPVNLTGRTIRLVVITKNHKRYDYSGTVNSSGEFRIQVDDAETKKWSVGKHTYRVELDSNGSVKWPLSGNLIIKD